MRFRFKILFEALAKILGIILGEVQVKIQVEIRGKILGFFYFQISFALHKKKVQKGDKDNACDFFHLFLF